MTQALLIPALLALAALGWAVATWWNADEQAAFGKALPGRVTFKAVLQGALRDVRDLFKLDVAFAWLKTNAIALAVLAYGMISVADPMLRDAILRANWHGIPVGALSLMLVTWLSTLKATPPSVQGLAPR